MICLFPDPYPDELLYSVCARYSALMQYPNKKTATEDFFGYGATAIVDLPTRLDYLINSLPPGHQYTANELIDSNTIFPFYAPYLPKNQAKVIRAAMQLNDSSSVGQRIGRARQGRKMSFLRFCPECVREDRAAFGETYWHRLHQLRGVDSCFHHSVFLEDSEAAWQNDKLPEEAKAAEFFVKDTPSRELDISDPIHLIHSKIAKIAYFLLNNVKDSINCEILSYRYKNLLLRSNLAHYNGCVRTTKLINHLREYYPEEFLTKIDYNIGTEKDWVNKLISSCQTKNMPHPICHILLLVFLNCNPEEVFDKFVEFKPFGDGPWPCLNPVGGHYKKPKVLSCKILPGTKKYRGKPRAVFSCSCGFVYARFGPDIKDEDRFTYSIVQHFGTKWETILRKLWNDKTLTTNQIASYLGVSVTTLKRRVVILGLPFRRSKRKLTVEIPRRYKLRRESKQALLQRKKEELLAFIAENPHLSRTELWEVEFSLVYYIQRADPKWLDQHLPPPLEPFVPRRPEINWEEEDTLLAIAVTNAISEIYSLHTPTRITRAAIARYVGNETRLRSPYLDKMPQTAKILKAHIESTEDYFVRRIRWVEELFRREQVIPMKSDLVLRAQIGRYVVSGNKIICEAMEEALVRLRSNVQESKL